MGKYGKDYSEECRERKEPLGNWLTNPTGWDICDRHETTFPMDERCPKCTAEGKSAEHGK